MTRARNSANLASQGNLFVDITNDRTGIGSVVPAQNLHVAGTAGFHADVTFTGDNARSTFWDRSTGFLKFNDNAYIKMGTSNDMSIYHDGTNNIIAAVPPQNLLLQSDDLQLQDCSNSHPYVKCVRDSYVRLYHDNSTRFQTAAYGVNVTGTTDTDGLVVSGVATVTTMNVTGVLTYEDVTSVDSVGIVTARQGVRVTADGSDTTNYISVGAGDDFRLFHDGSATYLKNNTGNLHLKSNTSDYMKGVISTGAVELNYGNTKKFETTNTGVSVTGAIASSGNLSISNVAPKIFLTDSDSNSDFSIRNMHGVFGIHDQTNSSDRLIINSSGNATFSGNLTVSGDLSVTGSTTQNNSVSTAQKTITLASGAANNAAADGAGIVVDAGSDTDKTLKWLDSTDRWTFTGGDVAANAFYGDGSNLTGLNVAINTLNNASNNRIITSSGGSTVNAEANLTFDGTRLLVGTTQTLSKLTVDTAIGVVRSSSDPTINLLLGTTSSITQLYRILIDDSDGDKLQVRDDDTPRITMDGSGNVGINETSPSRKLDVSGDILGNAFMLRGNTSASPSIQAQMFRPADNTLAFATNGNNERLRIDSNGKFLFGVTSARSGFFNTASQFNPHFQIEGAGDADDPGRVTSIIYNSTTTAGPTLLFGKTNTGSVGGTGAVANHHSLGLITFQGMVGGQFTQGATISAAVSGTPGDNDLPTHLSFATCADGAASASERVRITPAGRVGINQTDPQAMLQVDYDFDNSEIGLRLRAATGSGTKTWQLSEINGNAGVFTLRNASNGYNILNIDGANQRVGINQTNPQGILHISSGTSGDCKLIIEADTDNNNENDNPQIEFRQDGGQALSAIGHGLLSGNQNGLVLANSISTGYISFATGSTNVHTNATERVRISSDGDLGVGMGSPWARLVVHETNSNTSLTGHNYLASQSGMSIENGSTTNGCFSAYSARVKNAAGTQQSGSLAFKSISSGYAPEIHLTQRTGSGAQTTRFLISSDGTVSMGAVDDSSSSTLHIRSDTSTETTLELSTKSNYNGSLPSAKISFIQQNGTEIARIKCDTNTGAANMADLTFWTNYGGLSEKLRITKTGEVGINGGTDIERKVDIITGNGNSVLLRPNTGGGNSRGNANVVNNLLVFRMPYGENAGSSANAGARIGIQFTGRNDGAGYTDNPSKSASIYGISEDGTAGYTRQMGLAFFTSGFDSAQTEKMRLTNAGRLGLGETSPESVLHVQGGSGSSNSNGVTFESGSGGTAAKIMFAVNGNNDRSKYIQHSAYWTEIGCHNNEGVRFRESDGDIRFYMNGASGNYNFTGSNISDRNLKENIETITTNSIDLIKQVIPRTFNWKFDRKNIPHGGFIAQEMQPLFPKLINGVEYDESRTDDGDPNELDAGKCNPTGMGFDYNGYTAYLTKAMQELIAKVETLESKVDALEGS